MPIILATDLFVYLLIAAGMYFAVKTRGEGRSADVLRELRKRRLTMAALAVIVIYAGVALMDSIRWRDALQLSGNGRIYSPEALSLLDRALGGLRRAQEKTYSSPLASHLFTKENIALASGEVKREYAPLKYPGVHLLGTDKVGNDVLYMAIKGIRTAIIIGRATIIIIPFAIFFGVIAGYFGGVIDDVIQYVYITLASIPGVLLIVAFMLLFGNRGYQGGVVSPDDVVLGVFVPNDRLMWLCLILGITSWTDLCRLIRGETLKLRELEYVQAARALGAGGLRIIYTHVVPNLMHLVIITFVLQFSSLVLAEAILSYIGIGVGPQTGSWGNMINTARLELSRAPVVWWNLAGAFAGMFFLVLPANIFADAVRDALDPRLRNR